MKKWILGLLFWTAAAAVWAIPNLKEGDIVFRSEEGSFAKAIQLATHSPYNHVGLVLSRNGRLEVFEAVGPVQYTPLEEWIEGAKDGQVAAKRLKNADKVLTPKVLDQMKVLAKKFKGRGYSSTFDWSDRTMYCSELVWKMVQRTTGLELGKFQKLSEMDLSSPLVKRELKERFGGHVPLGLKIISPGQMFRSELFMPVEVR